MLNGALWNLQTKKCVFVMLLDAMALVFFCKVNSITHHMSTYYKAPPEIQLINFNKSLTLANLINVLQLILSPQVINNQWLTDVYWNNGNIIYVFIITSSISVSPSISSFLRFTL